MLKRPGGLERLAEYSAHSNIPAEFADAVDALWPTVSGAKQNLEMVTRLFRSTHPFRHELEAGYALFFGKSVGLVKALTTETDPDLVLQSILGRRTFKEYQLMEKIFNSWGSAISCESRSINDGWRVLFPWPSLYSLSHRLEIAMGLSVGPEHLNRVPQFLEDYFLDTSHRKDMIFHANLV